MVAHRFLARERRRLHESRQRLGHSGKQLAAAGEQLLGYVCHARPAWRVERGFVPAAIRKWRDVYRARKGLSIPQGVTKKIRRAPDVRKHRESDHGLKVGPGSFQAHGETSGSDARKDVTGEESLILATSLLFSPTKTSAFHRASSTIDHGPSICE